ncbi:Transcription factor SFP1 [Cyberlindnera fabianii]|uniref:Transcription factor SFP1 n=1 Tax=Cyberlindnera fabianii TaxID=36022 RepID=A0A1V2L6Q1_CYBFA|nr:Transcription factor SFP1 [Cyberlindnera fabianii]
MSNGFFNQIPNQESQPIDIYQRQDSVFGLHAPPQSININNSRNYRRESIAHSQGVGGISWGSVTIGSWLKEEVLMHNFKETQQAYNQTSMSPPVQSAYLPDLEANYCKDYSCCGQLLPTLHDLLKHYEESHISPTPPAHQPKPIQNFDTQFMLQQLQQGQIPDGQFAQHQLSQQHQQHPQQHTQPAPFPMSINNDDSTMDLDDEREEHFIDDPSRNLYVAQGSEKPFTCPVIGCNKTYKNQNGLKYHRLHGHQNQKLHQNPDGTYSVIDPNDGNAMEQDKPYRCEVCGKRYKNLNGLKYHRGHTTH